MIITPNLNELVSLLINNIGYIIVGYILLIIVGIILAKKTSLIVYRNFNDFGFIFVSTAFLMVIPILVGFSSIDEEQAKLVLYASGGLYSCCFVYIIINTFIDNKNPIFFLISMILKMSLSILYLFNILNLIAPKGGRGSRSSARRQAFLFLAILSPVIYSLVDDQKTGRLKPRKAI